MQLFLKSVAGYLYGKYGQDLQQTALVFPGRRAGLYFRNHLAGIIKKPVWLPRVMTISDLMKDLSGIQVADPITLNLKLYHVFRSVTGSSESFDRFYNWGEVMLADFDEVDKYMVDAGNLFSNIRSLKEIDNRFDFMTDDQVELVRQFWGSFNPQSPSYHQKEFLWIWEALPEIYNGFRSRLSEEGIAYEGMMFRHVAEKVPDCLSGIGTERFFIAGFNALNECEKRLFDHLLKTGRAEFFWDYDELYTASSGHPAGYFMHENLKRYPHRGFTGDVTNLTENPPEIEIVAVPSGTGQAKVLNEIEVPGAGAEESSQTAVVLPDESLLLPVLSSLPDNAGVVNVTMGYPLRETSLYGFVMLLAGMHSASFTNDHGNVSFPAREVISLLRHPDYPGGDSEAAARVANMIKNNNMVFVSADLAGDGETERLVFRRVAGELGFLDYLLEILDHMGSLRSAASDAEIGAGQQGNVAGKDRPGRDETVEGSDEPGRNNENVVFSGREFFMALRSALERLKDILDGSGISLRFGTLVKLLGKVLASVRIPFYGEPLGGLQVMGVLETRALDFDNVVWLSMNEGVFPSVNTSLSFIPYNLRVACRMPRLEQHEAVYSYYFYRLLQRARKVTLVYNTRSDGMFSGEVSRFIHQLRYAGRFEVKRKSLVFSLFPPDRRPVYIEKTTGVMERLYDVAGTGSSKGYLSAGALNSFMDCSLRFYFRYIARLPEPEKVTGEIDMAVFGNLLHKAACFLYRPWTGKTVTSKDIDLMLTGEQAVERSVKRAFEVRDSGDGAVAASGINEIVAGVMVSYLRQILERDRMLVPFTIQSLENSYMATTDIVSGGRNITVKAGGIIDRVDRTRGTTRVADYKTGGDDAVYRDLESLFAREDPDRKRAVFQTFFYSWLYLKQSGEREAVIPVLYQVKKLFTGVDMVIGEKPDRLPAKAVNDFRELYGSFGEHLKLLLEDLFNTGIPFIPTDNHDICRFCAYRELCHR